MRRDAGGQRQAGADTVPRLLPDRLADALAGRERGLRVGERHQREELLAAAAHDDVGGAQDIAEQLRRPHQHLVAGAVAVAVVDRLEVVEVDDGDAEQAADADGRWLRQFAIEEAAIVDAREPVALGLVAQLLLQRLELLRTRLELGVGLGQLVVLDRQRVAFAAREPRLQHRPLEAELELGDLGEGLALELRGAKQRFVCLLEPSGLAQRRGDRAEDHAAGVRQVLAEPVERGLPRLLRVIEMAERHARLHLRPHAGAEHVRVRLTLLTEQGQRALGVGQGSVRVALAQLDVGARGVHHRQRKAIRAGRLGKVERARDLLASAGRIAGLLEATGDVVVGDRLFPAVAGLDRQRQQLVQSRGEFAHADVAEHEERRPAGEDAQIEVGAGVRKLDRALGVGQRL